MVQELSPAQGQGWRPVGATPHPRSGGCVYAGGPRGATPRSRSGGAAVRRHPWSKVRSSGCALLEQPWRDTPCPRQEKPKEDGRCCERASEGRHTDHNHRKLVNLITQTTALSNSVKLSHTMWGHPRWEGHGGEVRQNVAHWRREWKTTSVFLPWEPHEQYEKAKW